MESRRPLHYHRNTIEPITIDPKEKKRRLKARGPMGSVIDEKHVIPPGVGFKHYARSSCIWCGQNWDTFRVVCPNCNNCQFCGLVGGDQLGCHLCGNTLPEELIESVQIKTIRIG